MTYYEQLHQRTSALHACVKDYNGREIIIDAAETHPNNFEIMACTPTGTEIECVFADTLENAEAAYAKMLSYHMTGYVDGMYTMEDWEIDREFSAFKGQEISEEICVEMQNCMPPLSLPLSVQQATGFWRGFQMGEPVDFDPKTYRNRYLTFGKKNGHYFYLGLFVH